MRLKGKRALVTGSSRGVGAAIARAFAEEGSYVIVNYRTSESDASNVVRSIKERGGEALAFRADISDVDDVRKLFSFIYDNLGGLDVLVNNAGYSDSRIWNAKINEITPDMWQSVFSVDVFGSFYCSQRAVSIMRDGGCIINISSTPAIAGDVEGLVYACAKASVLAMTKMLAKMLAPRIRVNCMILGSIETGWLNWISNERREELLAAIPLKRFGKPEEVANLAVFLASDESSYITGQGIIIDGGELML